MAVSARVHSVGLQEGRGLITVPPLMAQKAWRLVTRSPAVFMETYVIRMRLSFAWCVGTWQCS